MSLLDELYKPVKAKPLKKKGKKVKQAEVREDEQTEEYTFPNNSFNQYVSPEAKNVKNKIKPKKLNKKI